eukprot:SAG11_NODE_3699_length_2272_cov_59.289001_1_plen_633_part_00
MCTQFLFGSRGYGFYSTGYSTVRHSITVTMTKVRVILELELSEEYAVETETRFEDMRDHVCHMLTLSKEVVDDIQVIDPPTPTVDEQKLREVEWEGVTYYTYTDPMVPTDRSGSGFGAEVIFHDKTCSHVVAELHSCGPDIIDMHWIDQNAYDVHKTRTSQFNPEENHVGLRDVRYNNQNPFSPGYRAAEPEEPAAEPEEPPTEYSGWDVFYMHMTALGRSNIWKSVGPDPTDVMRITNAELDKFKEFKGLEYPVRADFLNDETNRTDFGLVIDTINQKLTEYSRIPKPHEPGVRRLDDELLAILIDAVNTIADEFRARPGMKPPNAVDILRYFLDARRRAAEPEEPPAEPKDRFFVRFLYRHTRHYLQVPSGILYDVENNQVASIHPDIDKDHLSRGPAQHWRPDEFIWMNGKSFDDGDPPSRTARRAEPPAAELAAEDLVEIPQEPPFVHLEFGDGVNPGSLELLIDPEQLPPEMCGRVLHKGELHDYIIKTYGAPENRLEFFCVHDNRGPIVGKLYEGRVRRAEPAAEPEEPAAEPVRSSRIGERKHRDDLPPNQGAFAHLPADQRPEVTMHMFEHEEFIRMMMDRGSSREEATERYSPYGVGVTTDGYVWENIDGTEDWQIIFEPVNA